MRRHAQILFIAASAVGLLLACVDDRPSNPSAVTGASDAAAGVSVGMMDAGCGPIDKDPCGCNQGQTCCVYRDGGSSCQPKGKEEPSAGCTSTNIIRCVSGTCGSSGVCCFNGAVKPGLVCPKSLDLRDTECVPIANDPAKSCTDPSGNAHPFMCRVDTDCEPYKAGKCKAALMDDVGRVMGICSLE